MKASSGKVSKGRVFRWIFGGAIFVLASFCLVWNEIVDAARTAALHTGSANVTSVKADAIEPVNEKRLVHVSGQMKTDQPLVDPEMGISLDALKVRRKVEMFQWKEEEKSRTSQTTSETKTTQESAAESKAKKKTPSSKAVEKSDGRTTEYYTIYPKVWSDEPIDSSRFKEAANHENPAMLFREKAFQPDGIKLGAFLVSEGLMAKLDAYQVLKSDRQVADQISKRLEMKATATEDGFYLGDNPASPKIGDFRVSYEVILPGQMSAVAQQAGNTLMPFATGSGGDIALLSTGTKSAQEMFADAATAAMVTTWLVRLMGYGLMFAAAMLLLRPIIEVVRRRTAPNELSGIRICGCWCAASLALGTIAVGLPRLFSRMLSGIILLALGLLIVLAMQRYAVRTSEGRARNA